MKITKSQKEAVIDLLREKFNEKEALTRQQFRKANEKTIRKKYAAVIDNYNKVQQLAQKLTEARNAYLSARDTFNELKNYRFGSDVTAYFKTEDDLIGGLCNEICPRTERPDFSKVSRQLELDSISPDFKLDEFLQKYLEK